jgi:hypothetical protein
MRICRFAKKYSFRRICNFNIVLVLLLLLSVTTQSCFLKKKSTAEKSAVKMEKRKKAEEKKRAATFKKNEERHYNMQSAAGKARLDQAKAHRKSLEDRYRKRGNFFQRLFGIKPKSCTQSE